jgi:hypothetical protein
VKLWLCIGLNSFVNLKHILENAVCFSDAVGVPPAPSLVAESLNATSLSLEWSGRGQGNNDTLFGVQWRYEEIPGSRWIFCCNHTIVQGTTRKIDNLTPYTKYRVICTT